MSTQSSNIRRADKTLIGGSLSHVLKRDLEVIKYYDGKHKRGFEKLRNEVEYIINLPKELTAVYPEIISVLDSPGYFEYRMPFYEMKSLSFEIFHNPDVKASWEKLSNILNFMYESHYPLLSTDVGVSDYIQNSIHTRLSQSSDSLGDVHIYDDILRGVISMNGLQIMDIKDIMAHLISDEFTNVDLRPNSLNLFHGNFHTDNLLVDDESFRLIDPRGDQLGSELYDACKMFVHMLVRYDEIHADKFKFAKKSNVLDIELTDSDIGRRYSYIQNKLLKHFENIYEEDFFKNSLLIIGGTHAVSFASYHARKENPSRERVSAYLSAGLYLLSAYIKAIDVDLKQPLFEYQPPRSQTK